MKIKTFWILAFVMPFFFGCANQNESPEPGPIMLQDHLAIVQYRNIWIMPNEPIQTVPPTPK